MAQPAATLNSEQIKAQIAAKPRSATLKHQLSRALATQGKLDEAIAQSLASLEYGKPRANFYAHLARLMLMNKMPRNAEMVTRQALNLGLQTAPLYYRLGQALGKQRKYADAVKCIDYAIQLDGQKPGYHRFRALLAKNAA